jgi:hypothetical protein
MLHQLILTAGLALLSTAVQAGEAVEAHAGGLTVTSKGLAAELGTYVKAEMAAKGGWLLIEDEGALVKLKPVKLDEGKHIHRISEKRFLSWGEFKSDKGDTYFVDFYFDVVEGKLAMSDQLTIYEKNKVKRYDWDESGPMMKKLEVKAKAKP